MQTSVFANELARRVEELVWMFAVQYEHDAGTSSISSEVLDTHFKPVFAEFTEVQKNIQKLRRLNDTQRGNKRSGGREQISFADPLGPEGARHDGVFHKFVEHQSSPLKPQADAVPEDPTYAMLFGKTSSRAQRKTFNRVTENRYEVHHAATAHESGINKRRETSAERSSENAHRRRETELSEFRNRDTTLSEVYGRPVSAMASIEFSVSDDTTCSREPVQNMPQDMPRRIHVFRIFDSWSHMRTTSLRLESVAHVRQSANPLFIHVPSHVASTAKDRFFNVPLAPHSFRRYTWDLFSALFICHDVVYIPMEFLDLPNTRLLEVLSWLVRIFWTLDLFLNFLTGYIKPDGLSELRFVVVAKRYASTWLFPDLLLVSFDWAEVIVRASLSETGLVRLTKSSRVLRVARALRLIRVGKAVKFLNEIGFALTSDKLLVVIDIMKILLLLIASTHVIACCWCGLGAWTDEHGFLTWKYVADMEDDSTANNYLVSCIWALSLFSGGTDFPLPQNAAERMFNSVMLLICFVTAAGVVSMLTSATTKLLLITSGPSKQMNTLRTYLAQNNVSLRLGARIQRNACYIAFEKLDVIPEEDVELLRVISEPLRTELAMEVRGPLLVHHPFFASYRHACFLGMRQICAGAASSKSIVADDVLFMMGERQLEPCMYFIEEGELNYKRQFGDSYSLDAQEWVAEAVLWTDWIHPGTFAAHSNCQVVYIDAARFQKLIKMFTNSREAAAVLDYAYEFVEHLNTLEPPDLTDLEWDQTRSGLQATVSEKEDGMWSRGFNRSGSFNFGPFSSLMTIGGIRSS